MLKFKREDVGLYVALIVTGAGTGLLLGAFWASRRPRKIEDILDDDERPIEVEDEDEPAYVTTGRIRTSVEDHPLYPEEEDEIEFQAELTKEWLDEWQPTQVQIQMYENGMASIDQLERLILEKRATDAKAPYTYNALTFGVKDEYGNVFKEGAFDEALEEIREIEAEDNEDRIEDAMDILVDEVGQELIDDRYMIYRTEDSIMDASMGVIQVKQEFIYDVEDGHLMFLSGRGKLLRVTDIRAYISEDTWAEVAILLTQVGHPIFVQDLNADLVYKFTRAGELEEDENPADMDANRDS